jgi:hypothetical protein
MWTFYVDVVEISPEKRNDLPKIILEVGEIPKEAPEKEFIADNPNEKDDDDEFDIFDDFDFNEY